MSDILEQCKIYHLKTECEPQCKLFSQMCFEWFTKGQHDLESDVQQQLFKEKILKLESYEITMNGM